MRLTIINNHDSPIPSEDSLRRIAELVDHHAGILEGELNVVFCDDDQIQELNKTYRKKDKVTDVLSFTYYADPQDPIDQRPLPEANELIGEVFISWPQTQRQANSYDWPNTILDQYSSLEMEVYKLCIHGMLHIRGYDHEEDDDYRVMKLLEDKIMDSFLQSEKQ